MLVALTVVLILVGFPLFAWWLGGRRRWARLDARGRDQVQAELDWVRRHRLDHRDLAEIGKALDRGRALDDDRLRDAAVERARMLREGERAWQASHPHSTAAMRWLSAVWLLAVLSAVVFAVASGSWPGWSLVYLIAVVVSIGAEWWRLRNLRRAIELNGG